MKEYGDYDALGLAELVAKKEVSSSELLDEVLKRARAAQAEVNCFSCLIPDIARQQIDAGLPESPFSGVPFPTKDLHVAIDGAPLTNGSISFKDNIADFDSTVVQRYRKAGLLLFARTNTPEFGITSTTESRLYGPTRNPWDVSRTSGGSSGGSSAVVASGVVPLAQASDGGGSTRIPAGCTGLVGMKPSRGRIPMGPPRTEGWQGLTTTHAVSRTVRDNAALMDLTHGPETGSRYIAPPPERSYLSELERDPARLKIAVWKEAPNGTKPDPDADEGLRNTAKLLESLGHHVEEAGPQLDGELLGKSFSHVLSAHSAAFARIREEALGRELSDDELEPVTRRMVEIGRQLPMERLVRADLVFQETTIKFQSWFDKGGYDLVLAPTMARKPDKLGILHLDTADMKAFSQTVTTFAPWTSVFNVTGTPSLSLPLHWTPPEDGAPCGLPIGMMFTARIGGEGLLYSFAGQMERAAPWAHRRPPVWVGDLA